MDQQAIGRACVGTEFAHHLTTMRRHTETVLDEDGGQAEFYGNFRYGFSMRTVPGNSGEMDIDVPRDRHSGFDSRLKPNLAKEGIRRREIDERAV